MKRKLRIQGTIIGAAVGDALGFVVEKKTFAQTQIFVEELRSGNLKTFTHRTHGSTSYDYKFGQYSDDTQFSVMLLKSLSACNGYNAEEYFKRLMETYLDRTVIGIGGNTRNIFKRSYAGEDISPYIKNSSNGSIMRSWPVGLFYKDKLDVLTISQEQSNLTHATEEAILACQVLASTIHLIMNSNPTKEELKNEWDSFIDTSFLHQNKEEFITFLKTKYPHPEWEYVAPGAIVTLIAVLYSAYHNLDNYEEGIYQSISLGGDTDSVASLTGAILGCYNGLKSVPEKWSKKLTDEAFGGYKELLDLAKLIKG